ncbi:MAG: hypothetical protein AMJ65_16100 [Phycisphaerae bacterium SG8_4]|nr:MAG: hypothetical protein AMJ65_16100 [Phycisphaerae bacterium SG8_4]
MDRTVPEIQVDQCLAGYTCFFSQRSKIADRVTIQPHRNRLFKVLHIDHMYNVRIDGGLVEIFFRECEYRNQQE